MADKKEEPKAVPVAEAHTAKPAEPETVIFAYPTGAQHGIMLRAMPKDEIPTEQDMVIFEHGYIETSDQKLIASLREHRNNVAVTPNGKREEQFRELTAMDAMIMREKIMKSRLPKRLYLRQLAVINGEKTSLFED